MSNRREMFAALGAAAVWPIVARAQQAAMPVIGFLGGGTPSTYASYLDGFRRGLVAAGEVEGRDVTIELHWLGGRYDQAPAVAEELVRRQVAVIVVSGSTAVALAAKAATTTIPIVFAVGGDPVKFGLVASFNRPGGNITGASFLANLLTSKQFELLHEIVPKAAAVGFLVNPANPNAEPDTREVRSAAAALARKLLVVAAHDEGETFAMLVKQGAGAVLISPDALFGGRRDQIVALAARHGLPSIYSVREYAMAGGLMGYGPNLADVYRQAGVYAGRILKGEKPSVLPVVQPTRFELVINLKTAKALGLDVPPTLLARADEVIE
jgi:putative ABC transport system substrate-binding protein